MCCFRIVRHRGVALVTVLVMIPILTMMLVGLYASVRGGLLSSSLQSRRVIAQYVAEGGLAEVMRLCEPAATRSPRVCSAALWATEANTPRSLTIRRAERFDFIISFLGLQPLWPPPWVLSVWTEREEPSLPARSNSVSLPLRERPSPYESIWSESATAMTSRTSSSYVPRCFFAIRGLRLSFWFRRSPDL